MMEVAPLRASFDPALVLKEVEFKFWVRVGPAAKPQTGGRGVAGSCPQGAWVPVPRLQFSNGGGVDRKDVGQPPLRCSELPPKSRETVRERLWNWGGVEAKNSRIAGQCFTTGLLLSFSQQTTTPASTRRLAAASFGAGRDPSVAAEDALQACTAPLRSLVAAFVLSGGHSKKPSHSCKCGFLGDPRHECRCTPGEIERYRSRISGPLLDRVDLHVEVLRSRSTSSTSNAARRPPPSRTEWPQRASSSACASVAVAPDCSIPR